MNTFQKSTSVCAVLCVVSGTLYGAPPTRVTVVNMIPQNSSGEVAHDGEPNIAVNPADPSHIVASAFTPHPTLLNRAPVFISTDGGATWTLNGIVPSANGMTGDITVRFGDRGGSLYAGILFGGNFLNLRVLRTTNPFGGGTMTGLINNNNQDQPYVEAATTNSGAGDVDRVYVGFNNWGQRLGAGGTGRTATELLSLSARTAPAPAGFNPTVIESRPTFAQDMPAIRTAVHSDGTVYAVFYSWTAGLQPNTVCDVVVVRDNNWGTGPNPFTALLGTDGNAGLRVVSGVTVPAFGANLGNNRLVASNLSIAVDSNNSSEVWLAWADNNGSNYTLHVRRSTDSGATWSTADVKTVSNATNPALAITDSGRVGFLYQQLVGTTAQSWETHFEDSGDDGVTWNDNLLARTANTVPSGNFFLGDYVHLMTVGNVYYGVFSAVNTPNNGNFPQGVTYGRNANFETQTLFDTDGITVVSPSIDPYFFKVEQLIGPWYCLLNPNAPGCKVPELEVELIRIRPCEELPCIVIDPLPQNCLVKWNCPGCGEFALCPPWFHIFLDDLDPRAWEVNIYTSKGDLVDQIKRRTETGVVLSFRPSKVLYEEGKIGDYVLGFVAQRGVKLGTEYAIPSRLEVSDYPVPEYARTQQKPTDGNYQSNR